MQEYFCQMHDYEKYIVPVVDSSTSDSTAELLMEYDIDDPYVVVMYQNFMISKNRLFD